MHCAARSSSPKVDQYVALGNQGLFFYESPSSNINAMLLDQPSGSPDAYQAQQALQQAASQEVTNESMTQAQNIARVMEMYREGASGQSTPENKRAGLDYATATIQAMSNSVKCLPARERWPK